jgi:quercetin dioxygenase-like cupin family protein
MGTRSTSAVKVVDEDGVVRLALGAVAAGAAWLGWLTVCPALGFPSLGPAAMLNRVLVPKADPGSWLGWVLLLTGLLTAALFYLAAATRGRFRPSVASGLVYGAICWLIAGALVMPLLGLADPTPASAAPPPLNVPDPMHGSFMMLHLGVGAAIAALVAWLLFGAILGAASASYLDDRRTPSRFVAGATVAVLTLVVSGLVGLVLLAPPPGSPVTATEVLATEPAQTLPTGTDYFSVLELTQPPGASLGPHAHPAGFVYSVKGVATVDFIGGQTFRVAPDVVCFIGTQAAHSHSNTDDQLPTAALALGIVGLGGGVALTGFRPGQRRRRVIVVMLVLLIAAGTLGTINPWQNDWLFISVRPVGQRGGPMPLPTTSRLFESADLGIVDGAPYVQTLEQITLAPGASVPDLGSTGPALLLVVDGTVEIQSTGGLSSQLGARGSTVIQAGESIQVSNAASTPAHVLKLSLTPAPQTG